METKPRFYGWLVLAILLYILAYFLLMARFLPVVENRVVRFKSTFRWAPPAPRSGSVYNNEGKATFFNYLFYPVDAIYYWIRPYDPIVPIPRPEE